ncbi:hypothetical protein LCM23_25575 [Cytobacillus kochii]|uniref:hypothetical protein n=1 Tax=Cytobacillus kochii TaxID=859143 RepID=UPI001CD7CB8C|nr:hypothetical protein [Cytobacillus kochii]MCA1029386.1 hypothetical protein [Cytobacillus kochii]
MEITIKNIYPEIISYYYDGVEKDVHSSLTIEYRARIKDLSFTGSTILPLENEEKQFSVKELKKMIAIQIKENFERIDKWFD